jgi:hypothetical protein
MEIDIGVIITVAGLVLLATFVFIVYRPKVYKIRVESDRATIGTSQQNIRTPKSIPTFIIDMGVEKFTNREAKVVADLVINYKDLVSGNYEVPERLHPDYDSIKKELVVRDKEDDAGSNSYIDLNQV